MRSAFAYKQQNFIASADQNFWEKKSITEKLKIDSTPLKINFRFFDFLKCGIFIKITRGSNYDTPPSVPCSKIQEFDIFAV